MPRLRLCGLALVLFASALVSTACTNRPLVRVCDPCGCRCVAAPLLEGCGAIPRPDDTADAAAAAKPADPTKAPGAADFPEWILSQKRVKGLVWEEINLDQAVTYLRTITGLEFVISPKVREERFEDIVYNLKVDDVSVRTVLDIMTQPFGLRWEARGKVVHLLTREETDGPMRLRYYDVKDLVGAEDGYASGDALRDALRREVAQRYWEREGATLEHRNGVLIVRASRGVLQEIDAHLRARRSEMNPYELPAEIRKKLDATKVNLSISKSTFGDVIKVLQVQTGMNIMVDPRIVSDVNDNPVVGVDLKDAPLSTALNMLAAAAGEDAMWVARGSVLVLSHAAFVREEFEPVK